MPHIHELFDFTVSAFILHPTERKYCLHYHKKLHSWLQVGGHVELHEDPLEALTHELQEEAGLNPTDYEIIGSGDLPDIRGSKVLPIPVHFNVHTVVNTHKHIDMAYLIQAKTDILQPAVGESQQIGWYSIDEIATMHDKGELLDGTFDLLMWIDKNYR